MFAGRRSARWALGFVERIFVDPQSVTRATMHGGERWWEWFGWSVTTDRLLQNTNVTLAAAGSKETVPGPKSGPRTAQSLDAMARQLMASL